MEIEFGIDAIDYYLPKIALKISSLAEESNIIAAKSEKGLESFIISPSLFLPR